MSLFDPSERTELIEVQRATTVRDGAGEETETFALHYRAYASVRNGTGGERRQAAQEGGSQASTFGLAFSQAAAGTTTATHSYLFTDAAATATSYYRLRQVDFDGTSTYSPVVTLATTSGEVRAAKPVAYPTVFTSELTVALPGADAQAATVALLTTDGRPVYSRSVQLSAAPQALAELPTLTPGLYLLRIATAAGATTQRVVRN